MSLRAKFVLYLILIHLAFAALAVVLLDDQRIWLLGIELFFAISLFTGIRLIQHFWVPLDLIRTGAELIEERDFTSKFLEVGQPEMDQLIRIYNRMIEQLREERTRLQEQHFFMDKILASAPSGIITLDFDERIALVNPSAEKLLQRSTEELAGKKLKEISSPFAQMLDAIEVGTSEVLPLRGQRRVRCHKAQFLDQGFSRSFVLLEELTEELRQSEKNAYEKVIRLLSHEVNNSIGAVNSLLHSCLNYSDQLSEEDREDYENALQVAIRRTDDLNAFMKSYAEVIRLPQPQRQPVEPRELLEEIQLLLSVDSQQRNIEWVWDEEEPPGIVEMDRNQMEQVFVNILKNAIEAIGEDGRVTLRLGKRDGKGWVAVEDTGGGIPPEVKAQLFTPFFSTKENGQGIGLTMVQEILNRHGFEFSLEGESGEPTRFEILFN